MDVTSCLKYLTGDYISNNIYVYIGIYIRNKILFKRLIGPTEGFCIAHFCDDCCIINFNACFLILSGLEIYTHPLEFTSSLSIRMSENCYWLALSDK